MHVKCYHRCGLRDARLLYDKVFLSLKGCRVLSMFIVVRLFNRLPKNWKQWSLVAISVIYRNPLTVFPLLHRNPGCQQWRGDDVDPLEEAKGGEWWSPTNSKVWESYCFAIIQSLMNNILGLFLPVRFLLQTSRWSWGEASTILFLQMDNNVARMTRNSMSKSNITLNIPLFLDWQQIPICFVVHLAPLWPISRGPLVGDIRTMQGSLQVQHQIFFIAFLLLHSTHIAQSKKPRAMQVQTHRTH